MPNRFLPIPANADLSTVINQSNQNWQQVDAEVTTKAFNNGQGNTGLVTGRLPNDLGTGTLLYGLDGKALISMRVDNDGNPSLKVAKSGYDATTAADADLIFNSAQNALKIVSKGYIDIPSVTTNKGGTSTYGFFNGTTTTIPHDLRYVPIVLAFWDGGGGLSYQSLPLTMPMGVGSNNFNQVTWRVSADNLNVYGVAEALCYNRSDVIPGTTATYYLLQETAN